MFARQVDPLAEYSSALSAAELHHRAQQEALDHTYTNSSNSRNFYVSQSSQPSTHHAGSSSTGSSDEILGGPSNSNSNGSNNNSISIHASARNHNPYKRKHAIHFEPDFFAALDASLAETADNCGGDHSGTSISTSTNTSVDVDTHRGSEWSTASIQQQSLEQQRPLRPVKRVKRSMTPTITSPKASEKLTVRHSNHSSAATKIKAASTMTTPPHLTSDTQPSTSTSSEQTASVDQPLRTSPSSISSPPPDSVQKSDLLTRGRIGSSGPSIIDLSSGEELVALHLGENEHKRRRDHDPLLSPTSESGPTELLQEVFEYQDDGTLLPILDHASERPSPTKKVRLSRAPSHLPHLQFLSECIGSGDAGFQKNTMQWREEGKTEEGDDKPGNNGYFRPALYRTQWNECSTAQRSDSSSVRSSQSSLRSRFWNTVDEGDMSADEDQEDANDERNRRSELCSSQSEFGAHRKGRNSLVRSKGGCNLKYFLDGLDTLDREHWTNLMPKGIIPLEEAHGNEVVLYQPTSALSKDLALGDNDTDEADIWEAQEEEGNLGGTDYHQSPTAYIEELDDNEEDDEGNLADDEAGEAHDYAPLVDMEEKIMDIDLD
ncbi:hypothetical protein EDD11_009402 [Mortierella claussenii]|nr:hypothetical protein EDD11_009402 [Mortierella claussenii]